MMDRLTTIASCETSAEAHMIRMALEAAGIRTVVSDGTVADSLWYLSPAIGGAKLQVAEQDASRAREILSSINDDADSSDPPWWCARCNEGIEANFKVCWSCGGLREEVEAPPGFTHSPHDDAAPQHNFRDRETLPEIPRPSAEEAANPYAPSQAGSLAAGSPEELLDEESPEVQEFEAIVRRAYVAAVLGLISCPGLLHLYSLFIVVPVLTTGQPLSPASRRRMYVAIAIDLVIVLGGTVLFFLPTLLSSIR